MEICFVRHGVAAERSAAYADDGLRPLTEEGRSRMMAAAAGLRTIFEPELILTSPLVRARQTADILSRVYPGVPLRVCDELGGGPLGPLLAALERTGRDRIIATGHEPQLSMAISLLVAGHEDAWVDMKKGGAALVRAERLAAGGGQLAWLLPPSVLRGLGASGPH